MVVYSYTEIQFLEVSVKLLSKLKIADVIGKVVWDRAAEITVLVVTAITAAGDKP
jgi:hypothetical protein